MEEEDKKMSGNRSMGQRKKSSRSKCKLAGRRNPSSVSRRRKKKTLAKLVSQNSIDNVHCFPIPFADFFCGCGKDCGKEKNKIKRISTKKLSKISKTANPLLKKIDTEQEHKESAQENVVVVDDKEESKECPTALKEDSETPSKLEECSKIPSDAFAALTEPLDFEKLKLNGNLKNLLANVKFTSIFGCANVPRTMSQIKILLDSNPALKTQLKHILGDNLKNENMKPVAELLASDKENSDDDLSNDSSFRRLSISKSVLETKNDGLVESVNSSFILSKKGEVISKSGVESEVRKRGSNSHSKSTRRRGNSRSNGSESQMSLFAKIFSSVFRPAKPSKSKTKKLGSRDSARTGRRTNALDNSIDDENMREMREKYDEWYKRTPEDVRERFRWEDYARVTMYLNDISDATSSNDDKAKEMLNLWLKKFNKEINRCSRSDECSPEGPISAKEQASERNNVMGTTFKRIISDEMLNAGGGDVIHRLNSLMKELVENTELCEERPHGDAGGDGDDCSPQDSELPGCSKWFDQGVIHLPEERVKGSTTTDEVSIYQMMCASFVDKLSKHGSKESKSIIGSRYTSEMPWQNKDFQVFYVPTIQTRFTLENLINRDVNRCENQDLSNQNDPENSSEATEEMESSEMISEESRATLDTRETETVSSGVKNSKSDFSDENKEYERPETSVKNAHKRVSFEENFSQDSSFEECDPNDSRSDDFKDFSSNDKDQSKEDIVSDNAKESDEQTESKVPSIDLNSIITACSSNNSDLSYILEHSFKHGRHEVSRESLQYIKSHKCELVEILKHLLSLASQNSLIFQSSEDKQDISSNNIKACVGVQCKISEEDTRKSSASSDLSLKKSKPINFQELLKSQSETCPRKVGSQSESNFSENLKLLSSLSDSGVHSNSSTSTHRRQFISLPDVLDGAQVVLSGDVTSDIASKQDSEDNMGRQDSSGSNLASCLSTSVSCQASQTPDVDDFSQASGSDLSDSHCRVLETRSSTTFKQVAEIVSSSEKSRSSENTRSCPEMQESKPTRSRIKNIFRRKSIKDAKK